MTLIPTISIWKISIDGWRLGETGSNQRVNTDAQNSGCPLAVCAPVTRIALECTYDRDLRLADEVGRGLLEPVFDAIRRTNKGKLSDEALAQAFEACWRHPLDWVAREYGFSDEMLAAGWEVAARTEVEAPMQGYPDLGALAELPAMLFLVTSGFRRLQDSKINTTRVALKIEIKAAIERVKAKKAATLKKQKPD